MNVIRLRLPKVNFDRNSMPSQTFIFKSDFHGEKNLASSDEDYTKRVEEGVGLLKNNLAKKIVLSRIISVSQQGLTSESIFNAFNEKFPNAAVFAFTDENNAEWIGATPELLFSKRGRNYSTISLAGTRKVGSQEEWGAKEKEEQHLVTEFIRHELEILGAENILCSELQTRNAGSIEHLCNEIAFEYKGDWKNVMKSLHPTPAVCGMPREKAKELIQQIEKHDREYYTGLIGIEQGDNVDVFVILRCLKIEDARLHIFVGAGITSESVPALEARETRWKAESLTEVIF
jgi:isochorismate synthase